MLSIPNKVSIICVLYILISFVKSSCILKYSPYTSDGDELRIRAGDGPLIYTYGMYGPKFRYPFIDRDRNCIFYSSNDTTRPDSRLHLACPGYFLQIHDRESHTILNMTYLMESTGESKINIHGYGSFNFVYGYYIKCTGIPISKMKINNTNKDADHFSIGFKLNVMDFLSSYKIINRHGSHLFGHITVISVIEKRPKFSGSYEYQEGIIYTAKVLQFLNFSKIYTREYQIERFQELLHDEKLVEKYFSDDNYLVKGHLISVDDLFYKAQRISAFHYENTFPVWRSINEGNWQLVSDVVRKLADQTVIDMEVFILPIDNLQINNSSSLYLGNLGNSENSPLSVNIPKILAKVVLSSMNKELGLVFHTVNDPYMSVQDAQEMMLDPVEGLCTKLLNCSDDYPEFLEPKRGLTFCCALGDSKARSLVLKYFRV